jgi:hypothetical protein
MPYLRLHTSELAIEQKRLIARKLIEITQRTFHLPPKERYSISIQFVSLPPVCAANPVWPSTPRDLPCVLEVMGHDVTERTKRAFSAEATAMLDQFLPLRLKNRITRLFGITPDTPRQIGFQFSELGSSISEPFVVHPHSRAA